MLKEVKLNCLNGKVIKEIVASEDSKWQNNKSIEGMYRDPTIFFEDGTQAVFGALGGESCHFWTNVQCEPTASPDGPKNAPTAPEPLGSMSCCASSFDWTVLDTNGEPIENESFYVYLYDSETFKVKDSYSMPMEYLGDVMVINRCIKDIMKANQIGPNDTIEITPKPPEELPLVTRWVRRKR